LLLAELSDVCYFVEPVARVLFQRLGFDEAVYFEQDGAQAYVVANSWDCVVICRGTEPNEWNDLRADLTAWMVLWEGLGHLHRGFSQEVQDLWPMIERRLAANEKTLWFTGHSLGAAMAAICAGRCMISPIKSQPAGLHTFGSPRVGNRRYVNQCRFPEYVRWVNNNDVVTRVPPAWMGYRHGGRQMYFNCDGRLRRLSKWQRTKDRWRGVWRGLRSGKLDPLSDHMQSNYIAHLAAAVAQQRAGVDVLGRTDRIWKRLVRRMKK
jgi:triacylglycerol lipase